MKRFALTALAGSMLAATSFGVQAAPAFQPSVPAATADVQTVNHRPGHRVVVKKRIIKKRAGNTVVIKKQVVKKRWARGGRVAGWKRYRQVDNYGRYGLYRPARGQHWVRVNNDYLLISIATGVIAGVIAGR